MAVHTPLISMTTSSRHTQPFHQANIYAEAAEGWREPNNGQPLGDMRFSASNIYDEAMSNTPYGKCVSTCKQDESLDWEGHKPIIVDLYQRQKLSMKNLIDHMSKNYNFKATKRMYHTRFTVWHVYKNMNSRIKNQLAIRVINAYRQGHEFPRIIESEAKKLIRYCKNSPDLSNDDRTTLLQAINSMVKAREASTSSFVLCSDGSQYVDGHASTDSPSPDGSNTPCSEMTPSSSAFETSSSSASSNSREALQSNPVSPLPPLAMGQRATSVELLLSTTRSYYEWQSNNPLCPPFELGKKFWTDVKNGIYFLKCGSYKLAWPLLRDAGQRVLTLCEYQPLNLLSEIYATLSPTNTQVCPALRVELLQLFARTASGKLGTSHPLAIICDQLQRDAEPETSVRALQLMINESQTHLSPQTLELYKLKRTLTGLLRRKKEYVSAEALCRSLIKSTSGAFGNDSELTRVAMSEYVHILTDQLYYEKALEVARAVLESALRDLGAIFPDERSIYAMEDMAEICERLGQLDQAIWWLQQAETGALRIWGQEHTTKHIQDKLAVARGL